MKKFLMLGLVFLCMISIVSATGWVNSSCSYKKNLTFTNGNLSEARSDELYYINLTNVVNLTTTNATFYMVTDTANVSLNWTYQNNATEINSTWLFGLATNSSNSNNYYPVELYYGCSFASTNGSWINLSERFEGSTTITNRGWGGNPTSWGLNNTLAYRGVQSAYTGTASVLYKNSATAFTNVYIGVWSYDILDTNSYYQNEIELDNDASRSSPDKFFISGDTNEYANYSYRNSTAGWHSSLIPRSAGWHFSRFYNNGVNTTWNLDRGVYVSPALKDLASITMVGWQDYNSKMWEDSLVVTPLFFNQYGVANTWTFGSQEIPPATSGLAINSISPANNTQFNYQSLNYSVNYTATQLGSNVTNCTLFLNGISQGIMNSTLNVSVLNWTNINTNTGTNVYQINCTNNGFNASSPTATFFVDTVLPTITTNFANNSWHYKDTFLSQFNFSDDQVLYSYNITIGSTFSLYNNSLNGANNVSYNLNLQIDSYPVGKNILRVIVADGHTADELTDDWQVNNGLFLHDNLQFKASDKVTDDTQTVDIKATDGSWLDKFTAQELKDRYVFTYEPANPKPEYTFDIKADSPIHVMNAPDTKWKKWLIIGDKWLDFDVKGEDQTVDIELVNDNEAFVTVSNIANPQKLQFESIGELNIINHNYTFYVVNVTESHQNTTFEGASTTFTLNLNMTNSSLNSSAFLIYNGVVKNATGTVNSSDIMRYVSTFAVPSGTPAVANWTWNFSVAGYFLNFSGFQNVTSMNITNCTAGEKVLEFILRDEELRNVADNSSNISIESTVVLTSILDPSQTWNFSAKQTLNNLKICLPSGMINSSNYTLDTITKFEYLSHVIEYDYIVNFLLTPSQIPKNVQLYDLASADSTSFLVTYKDENYLAVQNAIVDVQRYYVSEGTFRSVENGKTDEAGQTNAHLVTEDIIYKFNVYLNGSLEYSSPEYKALCQAVPCSINLRKTGNASYVSMFNYNLALDFDQPTQTAILDFSTKDGTDAIMNLSIYKNNGYDNETACSQLLVASSGTLTCVIPPAVVNGSYIIRVKEGYNSTMLAYRVVNTYQTAFTRFGGTGIMLTAFSFLTLALMGISSGVAVIVFGIVGIIFVTSLQIFDGGSIIGLGSAIIWIIVAGAILIYKMVQRKVQ